MPSAPQPTAIVTIRLDPTLGPPTTPIALSGDKVIKVGRALECDVRLPEAERTISRNHCRFIPRAGSWYIVDLESTHGSFVNDERLEPAREVRLQRGDRVRLGPWTYRVSDGSETNSPATIIDDLDARENQTLSVVDARATQIQRRRLELLLDCAKRIAAAEDEGQLGDVVLRMLQEGTGYSLAALVRPGELTPAGAPAAIDVVSVRLSERHGQVVLSRSLVNAAAKGQTVALNRGMTGTTSLAMNTIADSGVRFALCVPIMQGGKAALCLYLDSHQTDRTPEGDAAAFCQAVAELCALALSNMRRARLEQEKMRDAEQWQAALDIQRGILPPASGTVDRVDYVMAVEPGKQVSGDLFDIMRLDDGRIAFFVGDVTGKGVPAAILSVTTQSYLHAALRHHGDVARAVTATNRHLIEKSPEGKFVTLWCGALDPKTGELEFVDAGHGYALLCEPGQMPRPIESEGGFALRVADMEYEAAHIRIATGTRVVLYSDGVAEQPSKLASGATSSGDKRQMFGLERTIAAIAKKSVEPKDDVQLLVNAVRLFSGNKPGEALADDLTVASIRLSAAAEEPR